LQMAIKFMGKPANEIEAKAMLVQLRSRVHQVYTALAVYDPYADHMKTDLAVSNVQMRDYTDEEIAAYVPAAIHLTKPAGMLFKMKCFVR
jgi:septum formation protein